MNFYIIIIISTGVEDSTCNVGNKHNFTVNLGNFILKSAVRTKVHTESDILQIN